MDTPQSVKLSEALSALYAEGRTLVDHSTSSELVLRTAIHKYILPYAAECVQRFGGEVRLEREMSLYKCQEYFQRAGGPPPDTENRYVSMKPDGGILIATVNGKDYPLLITEDKVQGTNDLLFNCGKKRQSLGNAIERAGKNIRGAEMVFAERAVYPYCVFASGCDFHHSETISKRIEMMNYGVKNKYIHVSPDGYDRPVTEMAREIDIRKLAGKWSVANVFVKAHKYDVMPNGSSKWTVDEIVEICRVVIDQSLADLESQVSGGVICEKSGTIFL